MSLKKSALVLTLSAAMALLNTFAFAIDMSSSQVIKTTGKVSVKKVSSPEFKKLNSNLKLAGSLKNLDGGDKVRTFTNSTADLALKDTCILLVKEQSIFEVPQVLTQKDLKILKAQQGSVLFKVAKGSNFQVQTADVVCGVKGTMFSVNVVDGLDTLIETPGLQLGYASAGETSVEVYEGEVEVKDKKTSRVSSLKPGQGLVSGINKCVSYLFEVESRVKKIFGNSGQYLLKLENLNNASDLLNVINDDFSPKSIKNTNYYKQGYSKLNNSIENKAGFGIGDIKEFEVQKFNVDFEKYPKLGKEQTFSNNMYGEAYIGKNTFVACRAANGSTSLKAEPGEDGIVITEGRGNVVFQTFDKNLNTIDKVLVSLCENENDILTVVRNSNGKLCWREPGSLDIQRVPQGDVTYAYNKKTAKGSWYQASSNLIPNEFNNFEFSTIKTLRQQKKQVDQANTEKKANALLNIGEKVERKSGKGSGVTSTIKSFGGLFKRKR